MHWLDDPEDPTIVDLTDDVEQETPTVSRVCARCGKTCIIAGPDDCRGGLPEWCARSQDRKWAYCVTAPRRVVFYPDGR
jgi:hypothetical protein